MRILILTSEVPYPPDSGGRLKTHAIIEFLRHDHELTVLCFRRQPLTAGQEAWLRRLRDAHTVPLNRGRGPQNLARSYLSRLPLSIERNRSPRMAALATEHLHEERYQAVFVDHWLMAQYMPADFPGLRLFHEHNAEYMIWLREARAARNPLMRSLLKLEYERVRRYEAGILQRFDLIFAVSGPDRDALIEQGAAPEKVQVLPNLPDPDLLDSPELGFKQSEALALFLGTLSWKPNIDSATRLLIKIFPAVQSRNPAARLLLAGTGAPKALMALAERTPGVEFLPDVHDTDGLYRRARVFVEATETGGGTKLKVLNALARGLPVVASPEGASGLEVTPGENILIGRDDSELAGSVERLMTDEALWRRLSECGRQLVREKYVAENAFSPLKALSGVPNHG